MRDGDFGYFAAGRARMRTERDPSPAVSIEELAGGGCSEHMRVVWMWRERCDVQTQREREFVSRGV